MNHVHVYLFANITKFSRKFLAIQYSLTVSPCIQILDAMNQDSELHLNSVRVDGGMTENKLMLQLQADILGIKMGTTTYYLYHPYVLLGGTYVMY